MIVAWKRSTSNSHSKSYLGGLSTGTLSLHWTLCRESMLADKCLQGPTNHLPVALQ